MAKYLVESELRQVADLIKTLNDGMRSSDIAIGSAPVYDTNGDTLGYIGICEGGMYAFMITKDED